VHIQKKYVQQIETTIYEKLDAAHKTLKESPSRKTDTKYNNTFKLN